MPEDNKWRERGESFRGIGLALAIPFVLVGSPVFCAALLYWASEKYGWWTGWIYIGAVIGLAVGIFETVKIVRKLTPDSNK